MSDPILSVCLRVSISWMVFLIATACAHSGTQGASPQTWTVFVHARAPQGGDGTAQRPWKSLTRAVASGATEVVLAPGTYEGPWRFEHPITLRGSGPGVILAGVQAGPVFWTMADVTLDTVEVHGGEVGLEGRQGRWRIRNVTWVKQNVTALRVHGAKADIRDSRFVAGRPGGRGIEALAKANIAVESSHFEGTFARAVSLEDSGGTLRQLTVRGAKTAVHASGSKVDGEGWVLEGTGGPGIFGSASQLQLTNVQVTGHEYALLCNAASNVALAQFQSSRAQRAGIGIVKSTFKAQDVTILAPGPLAGIQLTSTRAQLRQVTIRETKGFGLQIREGNVELTGGTFIDIGESANDDGDAVHVRAGTARLDNVQVSKAAGAGVFASEHSEISLKDWTVTGAQAGALVLEGKSKAAVSNLKAERCSSAAVNVFDGAQVQADGIDARKNPGGLLLADCSQGVEAKLMRSWELRHHSPKDRTACARGYK